MCHVSQIKRQENKSLLAVLVVAHQYDAVTVQKVFVRTVYKTLCGFVYFLFQVVYNLHYFIAKVPIVIIH